MHRKNPNRKFSLRFGKEETSTEDKKPCLQGFVPSWSFLTRLRRPHLFSRKRKDGREKSAWGRGVHAASDFRRATMFQSGVPLGGHLTYVLYAPPDTVGIRFVTSFFRISAINRRCGPDSLVCTFLRGRLLCLPHPYKRQRPPMASPHRGRPFCCGGMQNGIFCPGSFLSRKNRV